MVVRETIKGSYTSVKTSVEINFIATNTLLDNLGMNRQLPANYWSFNSDGKPLLLLSLALPIKKPYRNKYSQN